MAGSTQILTNCTLNLDATPKRYFEGVFSKPHLSYLDVFSTSKIRPSGIFRLQDGFSNCGKRTITGATKIVDWYTALKKN
jgi:hypothetical protein